MPVTCFVPGCGKRRSRGELLSFHAFPKRLCKEWLTAIGRDPDTFIINQKVCSSHFNDYDFEGIGLLKRLKANIIPYLNVPTPIEAAEGFNLENVTDIPSSPSLIEKSNSQSNTSDTDEREETLNEVVLTKAFGPQKRELLLEKTKNSGKKIKVLHPEDSPASTSSSKSSEITRHGVRPDQSSPASTLSNTSSVKRRIIKIIHNYSLSPEHYKKQINVEKGKANVSIMKCKSLKQRTLRLKRKITSLRQVVTVLNKKYSLSNDAVTTLESSFSGIPLVLLKRMLTNLKRKGHTTRRQYPEELRSFAMRLQFYSRKAYNYVRRTFDFALPAESTISAWLANITCEPGFSKLSIDSLNIRAKEYKAKYGRQLLGCLILDEMSIKKELVYDNGKIWGYVDVGTETALNNEQEVATEALVLMVVSINDYFKLPIAYFFLNRINGEEKANIVNEALYQLSETQIKIVAVTCDGPQVNFKMMKCLGCNVTDVKNMNTSFKNPVDGSSIRIIFYICHMIKLVRNNWAQARIFIDQDGNEIKWEYIELLHKIQENEGLYLGNKLRRSHIQWRKAIMKVNLAVQTLSTSVADALQYLCDDLEMEEFKGVLPTVKFLRVFDKLFDLCNSRNPFERGMKTPMREENEFYWKPFLLESLVYISELKDKFGKLLYLTPKKTPILVFLASANSLLNIYDEELKANKNLKYILTYKFSQDHLELFFCSIRSRNGWINNPNCVQFMRSYKRLLIHQDVRSNTGNCIAQDQTNILTVTSQKRKLEITDVNLLRKRDEEVKTVTEKVNLFLPSELNEYSDNVVTYISGFVVKKLESKIHCQECRESIRAIPEYNDCDPSFKLICRKSKGGLIFPSISVQKVCKRVETYFQRIIKVYKMLPPNDTIYKFLLKQATSMFLDENLFSHLRDHVYDYSPLETHHKKILIEECIKCYASIRINSIVKSHNEIISGEKMRRTLTKLILFKHQ